MSFEMMTRPSASSTASEIDMHTNPMSPRNTDADHHLDYLEDHDLVPRSRSPGLRERLFVAGCPLLLLVIVIVGAVAIAAGVNNGGKSVAADPPPSPGPPRRLCVGDDKFRQAVAASAAAGDGPLRLSSEVVLRNVTASAAGQPDDHMLLSGTIQVLGQWTASFASTPHVARREDACDMSRLTVSSTQWTASPKLALPEAPWLAHDASSPDPRLEVEVEFGDVSSGNGGGDAAAVGEEGGGVTGGGGGANPRANGSAPRATPASAASLPLEQLTHVRRVGVESENPVLVATTGTSAGAPPHPATTTNSSRVTVEHEPRGDTWSRTVRLTAVEFANGQPLAATLPFLLSGPGCQLGAAATGELHDVMSLGLAAITLVTTTSPRQTSLVVDVGAAPRGQVAAALLAHCGPAAAGSVVKLLVRATLPYPSHPAAADADAAATATTNATADSSESSGLGGRGVGVGGDSCPLHRLSVVIEQRSPKTQPLGGSVRLTSCSLRLDHALEQSTAASPSGQRRRGLGGEPEVPFGSVVSAAEVEVALAESPPFRVKVPSGFSATGTTTVQGAIVGDWFPLARGGGGGGSSSEGAGGGGGGTGGGAGSGSVAPPPPLASISVRATTRGATTIVSAATSAPLRVGGAYYADRDYKIISLPRFLRGDSDASMGPPPVAVQTHMQDKSSSSRDTKTVCLAIDAAGHNSVIVHVLFDARASRLPGWLSAKKGWARAPANADGGATRSFAKVAQTDQHWFGGGGTFDVYYKRLFRTPRESKTAELRLCLGGNKVNWWDSHSMYSVLVSSERRAPRVSVDGGGGSRTSGRRLADSKTTKTSDSDWWLQLHDGAVSLTLKDGKPTAIDVSGELQVRVGVVVSRAKVKLVMSPSMKEFGLSVKLNVHNFRSFVDTLMEAEDAAGLGVSALTLPGVGAVADDRGDTQATLTVATADMGGSGMKRGVNLELTTRLQPSATSFLKAVAADGEFVQAGVVFAVPFKMPTETLGSRLDLAGSKATFDLTTYDLTIPSLPWLAVPSFRLRATISALTASGSLDVSLLIRDDTSGSGLALTATGVGEAKKKTAESSSSSSSSSELTMTLVGSAAGTASTWFPFGQDAVGLDAATLSTTIVLSGSGVVFPAFSLAAKPRLVLSTSAAILSATATGTLVAAGGTDDGWSLTIDGIQFQTVAGVGNALAAKFAGGKTLAGLDTVLLNVGTLSQEEALGASLVIASSVTGELSFVELAVGVRCDVGTPACPLPLRALFPPPAGHVRAAMNLRLPLGKSSLAGQVATASFEATAKNVAIGGQVTLRSAEAKLQVDTTLGSVSGSLSTSFAIKLANGVDDLLFTGSGSLTSKGAVDVRGTLAVARSTLKNDAETGVLTAIAGAVRIVLVPVPSSSTSSQSLVVESLVGTISCELTLPGGVLLGAGSIRGGRSFAADKGSELRVTLEGGKSNAEEPGSILLGAFSGGYKTTNVPFYDTVETLRRTLMVGGVSLCYADGPSADGQCIDGASVSGRAWLGSGALFEKVGTALKGSADVAGGFAIGFTVVLPRSGPPGASVRAEATAVQLSPAVSLEGAKVEIDALSGTVGSVRASSMLRVGELRLELVGSWPDLRSPSKSSVITARIVDDWHLNATGIELATIQNGCGVELKLARGSPSLPWALSTLTMKTCTASVGLRGLQGGAAMAASVGGTFDIKTGGFTLSASCASQDTFRWMKAGNTPAWVAQLVGSTALSIVVDMRRPSSSGLVLASVSIAIGSPDVALVNLASTALPSGTVASNTATFVLKLDIGGGGVVSSKAELEVRPPPGLPTGWQLASGVHLTHLKLELAADKPSSPVRIWSVITLTHGSAASPVRFQFEGEVPVSGTATGKGSLLDDWSITAAVTVKAGAVLSIDASSSSRLLGTADASIGASSSRSFVCRVDMLLRNFKLATWATAPLEYSAQLSIEVDQANAFARSLQSVATKTGDLSLVPSAATATIAVASFDDPTKGIRKGAFLSFRATVLSSAGALTTVTSVSAASAASTNGASPLKTARGGRIEVEASIELRDAAQDSLLVVSIDATKLTLGTAAVVTRGSWVIELTSKGSAGGGGGNFVVSRASLAVDAEVRSTGIRMPSWSASSSVDTVSVTLRAELQTTQSGRESDILLSGTVTKPFHPMGQNWLVVHSGSVHASLRLGGANYSTSLSLPSLEVRGSVSFSPDLNMTQGGLGGHVPKGKTDFEAVLVLQRDGKDASFTSQTEFTGMTMKDVVLLASTGSTGGSTNPTASALHADAKAVVGQLQGGLNISLSNYDWAQRSIVRGLCIDTIVTLPPSPLRTQLETVVPSSASLGSTLTAHLHLDLPAANADGTFDLSLQTATAKLELFASQGQAPVSIAGGATLSGFAFVVEGLFKSASGAGLRVSLESVLEIELPGGLPKIRTTVDGEWTSPTTAPDGSVIVEGQWRLSASARLTGKIAWAPMGLDVLRFSNPALRVVLTSPSNGDSGNAYVVERIEISSFGDTHFGDRFTLVSPTIVVTSFAPEKFTLQSDLRIGSYPSEPVAERLLLSCSGSYDASMGASARLDISGTQASKVWRPLGADMVDVVPPSAFEFFMKPPAGGGRSGATGIVVDEMGYTGTLSGRFPKRVRDTSLVSLRAAGEFTPDLSDVCFRVEGITMSSMGALMEDMFGTAFSSIARNMLGLGDIETAVGASVTVASMSSACSRRVRGPATISEGYVSTLDVVLAAASSTLPLSFAMLSPFQPAGQVRAQMRITKPPVVSEQHPLLLSLSAYGKTATIGPLSLQAFEIEARFGAMVSLTSAAIALRATATLGGGESSSASFAVKGTITSVTADKTTIELSGSMAGEWVKPLGAPWLTLRDAALKIELTRQLDAAATAGASVTTSASIGGTAITPFGEVAARMELSASSADVAAHGDMALVCEVRLTESDLSTVLRSLSQSEDASSAEGELHGLVLAILRPSRGGPGDPSTAIVEAAVAVATAAKRITMKSGVSMLVPKGTSVALSLGVTLGGGASISAAGQWALLGGLSPWLLAPGNSGFTLNAIVHAATADSISIGAAVTGGFKVGPLLEFQELELEAAIKSGGETALAASGKVLVHVPNQPNPLVLTVSTIGQESWGATLSGAWEEPFGIPGATIKALSFSTDVSAKNDLLRLAARGELQFSVDCSTVNCVDRTLDLHIAIQVSASDPSQRHGVLLRAVYNHADHSASATTALINAMVAAQKRRRRLLLRGGRRVSSSQSAAATTDAVGEMTPVDTRVAGQLSLTLASGASWGEWAGEHASAGATVAASFQLKRSGKIANALSRLGAPASVLDAVAEGSIWVPLLGSGSSALPFGAKVSARVALAAAGLQLPGQRAALTGIEAAIDATQLPPVVSVSALLSVDISPQGAAPAPLGFRLSGVVGAASGVVLRGELQGTWEDAFGLTGFTLRQAGVEVGIMPAPAMATVGLSVSLAIGSKTVTLAGKVSSATVLLVGTLSNELEGGNGMGLSLFVFATWWYSLRQNPTAAETAFLDSPWLKTWGLGASSFFLSTAEQTLLGRRYPAGVAVTTGLSLFGLQFSLSARLTHAVGKGVMFDFDGSAGLADAENVMFQRLKAVAPAELYDPSLLSPAQYQAVARNNGLDFAGSSFFELHDIRLSGLTLDGMASNKSPTVTLEFSIWGHRTSLEVGKGISLATAASMTVAAVHAVLDTLTNTVFKMPECVFDDDCFRFDDTVPGANAAKVEDCRNLCVGASPGTSGTSGTTGAGAGVAATPVRAQCPQTCYIDDEVCLGCFGACVNFKCKWNGGGRGFVGF